MRGGAVGAADPRQRRVSAGVRPQLQRRAAQAERLAVRLPQPAGRRRERLAGLHRLLGHHGPPHRLLQVGLHTVGVFDFAKLTLFNWFDLFGQIRYLNYFIIAF